MGKTPALRLTRSGGTKDAHPLTLGGSQAAVATPAPPTASARSADTQTLSSPPPPPSGRGVAGETGWPSREAGRESTLIRALSLRESSICDWSPLSPDSGRGRVFLGQALCMPPEPQGPCLGARPDAQLGLCPGALRGLCYNNRCRCLIKMLQQKSISTGS